MLSRVLRCWMGHSGGTPNMRAPGPLGSGITLTASILWAADHIFKSLSSEVWLLFSPWTPGGALYKLRNMEQASSLCSGGLQLSSIKHTISVLCSSNPRRTRVSTVSFNCLTDKRVNNPWRVCSPATWSLSWPTAVLLSLPLCLLVVARWHDASPARRPTRFRHTANYRTLLYVL